MTKEQIEKAAKEAAQDYFQCNGKYPCEERDHCEFCNGHNSAFDCKEDCGADNFNEGFIAGVEWRINSVWHDAEEEPKQNAWFIAQMELHGEDDEIFFDTFILRPDEYDNWQNWWEGFNIKRWAYIDDLLPERKEVSI